jgi:hypothetical protein
MLYIVRKLSKSAFQGIQPHIIWRFLGEFFYQNTKGCAEVKQPPEFSFGDLPKRPLHISTKILSFCVYTYLRLVIASINTPYVSDVGQPWINF